MATSELIALVLGGMGVTGGVILLAKVRFAGELPGGLSRATLALLGFVLVMIGYHAVAYAGPAGWITFAVPRSAAWVVGALLGLGVVVSLWLDRRDRAGGEPEG